MWLIYVSSYHDNSRVCYRLMHTIKIGTVLRYGPLARYVKIRVAHAPVMPGTFCPTPRVIDPDMHHGTCVTHVPSCMPGSITSGFIWSRCRGKHSRRMRNPQFSVSGKRPMHALMAGACTPSCFLEAECAWQYHAQKHYSKFNVNRILGHEIVMHCDYENSSGSIMIMSTIVFRQYNIDINRIKL